MVYKASEPALVSVVMAVKNGGDLVARAIESILNQTYRHLELIVIDDGSDDNTWEVLQQFSDPRMQVYTQANQGVAKTANRGLSLATGKYIARQDHDDFSLPSRLEKQVAFLDAHEEVGLVGTRAEIWSMQGPTGRFHDHPIDPGVLAFELLFNNPFVHSSCMFRSSTLKTIGNYNSEPGMIEDYELISRLARVCKVANLAERLVIYQETQDSLSRPKAAPLHTPTNSDNVIRISSHNLALANGLSSATIHTHNLAALMNGQLAALKGKPNYGQMQQLLRGAGERISQSLGGIELVECISLKSEELRYRYFIEPGLASQFESLSHRLGRRAHRLLKQVLRK